MTAAENSFWLAGGSPGLYSVRTQRLFSFPVFQSQGVSL